MGRKRIMIFPLYEEVHRITAALSDEQMGKAIRRALDAYYGGESAADGDGMVQLSATMLLAQAGRYDKYRERQRSNAKKLNRAGEPNAAKVSQSKPSIAKGSQGQPSDPPNPNPSPSLYNTCVKAVQLLNDLSGSSFRATTKSTQKLIAAREKDGYTLEDIEMVIRHQCGLWAKDANMSKYLRPETLFGNKFEGYLSDAKKKGLAPERGYTLASLEDPWDVAMREDGSCV